VFGFGQVSTKPNKTLEGLDNLSLITPMKSAHEPFENNGIKVAKAIP